MRDILLPKSGNKFDAPRIRAHAARPMAAEFRGCGEGGARRSGPGELRWSGADRHGLRTGIIKIE
jgi:hypothetical protein